MLRLKDFSRVWLFIGLLISLALSGCSSEHAKAKHLERGENYLTNRQYTEAILEFRSAIEIDKKTAAAHFGLARAYEGQERFTEAIEELRKTVDLDSNNLIARVKLGNYLLLLQPPGIADTEKLLGEIFAVNGNYIEGHILKATLFAVQAKPDEEVLKILDHAITLDVARVESYLSKARFLVSRQNVAEAEKVFQKALQTNASSVVAHIDYGRFLDFTNRADEAEKNLRRAVELEPANRQALEALASFYTAQKKFERAEEVYTTLANLEPNKLEEKIILADFYASANRETDAIRVYQEILTSKPEFVRARASLGELLLRRDDLAGVNEQAQQILSRNARDVAGLLLRARIRLKNNDSNTAIKDLQEALRQEPSHKLALYYMADAQLRAGKIEQARSFIADLKRFHPNYWYADQFEINVHFAEGQLEKAQTMASALLHKLQTLRRGELSERDVRELKVGALTARGLASLQLGKTNEAKNDLTAAQIIAPDLPNVYLNLAKVALRIRDLAEAQNLFAKALEIDANNFDALSGLINVKIRQEQFETAHALLDARLNESKVDDRRAALFYLKSQIFNAERKFVESENVLQRATQSDPGYLPAYLAYAALLSSQNQTDRAIERYRAALERNPNDANLYTLIGLLEDVRENVDAALENYKKALELDANQAIAANNLSWLYAAHNKGNLDEAAALMQDVVEKHPNEASYADTLGWVFYKKGVAQFSLAQFRRAVTLDEKKAAEEGRSVNAGYQMRLGAALMATGDKTGARREIATALQNSKSLTPSELEQANVLLQSLN